MNRTLVKLLLVTLAGPLTALAQVPTPAPAPKPAAPPRAPAPKVAPTPEGQPWRFEFEHDFHMLAPKLADIHINIDEMRLHALELAQVHLEDFRWQAEDLKWNTELLKADKLEQKWEMLANRDIAANAKAEALANVDVQAIARAAADAATSVRVDFNQPGFGKLYPNQERFFNARPPEPWAQEDPADSLYRVAREALTRGEYRRSAQLFNEITRKFSNSRYAQASAYWEAFSRYRIGTTDELRLALRILEGKGEGVSLQADHVERSNSVDIPALRARILGVLASRGDRDAQEQLQRTAQNPQSCDREEVSVRAEALSALAQMDIATALPTVKKVLARRDECTVELRRRALHVIGRQPGSEGVAIILDVAKNDPDEGIRGEAMRWLPRVAGDAAVPQLEELLRTAPDERTQRSAISALGSIDSELARRAVRTIIERADASERIRSDAIASLVRERDGRSPSAEELNYVRGLYGKMPTPKLKEAVLSAVSRVPGPENEQFLLAVARNVNEPPQLRAAALQRLGRMEAVKVGDIAKLYEVADSRSMREQILQALSQRKEDEAVDKMIDIAKRDTDPQIRRYAVNLLSRSNNERAKKFFQELFDK